MTVGAIESFMVAEHDRLDAIAGQLRRDHGAIARLLVSPSDGALIVHRQARMISRRAAMGAFGALVLVGPGVARAQSYAPLFWIERSKNANIVQYDAVLANAEALDPRNPVVGYWVMKAEDGRREGFSALDKQAYGFRVVREPNAASHLMYLAASKDRAIRILKWNGRWVAQIAIRGAPAVLERLFIATDERGLIPSVRYVDIFGRGMASGEPMSERITPK